MKSKTRPSFLGALLLFCFVLIGAPLVLLLGALVQVFVVVLSVLLWPANTVIRLALSVLGGGNSRP